MSLFSPAPIPFTTSDGPSSLADAGPNRPYLVRELCCERAQSRRLAELGIVPGAAVSVLRGGRRGALIVKVDACRLGIGRAVASKVIVAPAPDGAGS